MPNEKPAEKHHLTEQKKDVDQEEVSKVLEKTKQELGT